ncbi:hypothetical protein JRQ81_019320 [Phrynocephalus forsythii]|uniref:DNA repair protein complementing XP-G cells n=1 Tax=Phrynocephalus forsythii TaxID=171643 RepID=A0A9Q1AXV0_9SAUR|nr:hypothetical protein JRQ81_019320 [Phrynocephalus forsythii]
MGVQGLWKLLESSGRPISPETLEGKILAVDISIWLNQAIKGARDRRGNSIHSAHLLTLFHRLCKLLFFRIRPVFVFDGEAPLLKRQTLVKRRQRKEIAASDSKKTTEKLLKTFLKRQAIKTALAGKSNTKFPSLSEIRREEVDDIYALPSLQEDKRNSSDEEDEKEWEERMTQKKMLQEELCENPHSVDVDSEDFQSLPSDVKHEILTDMKEFAKRRRTLYETMPEESGDFSQYQLKGLLKKSSLNRHIEKVQKEMNEQHSGQIQSQYESEGGFLKEVETRRVVSEDASHYILIKGLQSKTQTSKDLETVSTEHSPSVSEGAKPGVAKIPADSKASTCDLSNPASASSTGTTPPSPRTMLAIQTAMLGSSSEEEMEDENKNKFDLDKCRSGPNTEAGNVSPRTLRAIQEALCEEEEDVRPAFIPSAGASREGRPSTKDFLASSSDEEDQVPDSQSGKHLPFLHSGQFRNTAISQENDLDQRKPVLEKDQSVPDSPGVPFVGEHSSSESDKEEKGMERPIPDMASTLVQDGSAMSDEPPLVRFLTQTLPADLTRSDSAELSPNGKVESLQALVLGPEKGGPPVPHELPSEAAGLGEERPEGQPQSEESDSDGSFIDVDAGPSGDYQDEPFEMPVTSAGQEDGRVSEEAVDIREEGEDLVERWPPENAAKDVELVEQEDHEIRHKEKEGLNEWQDISMVIYEMNNKGRVMFCEPGEIISEELEVLETNLSIEQNTLQAQKQQQERVAATVTGQMFLECQELLRLFGIPYIQAPMEAEAQCAVLDLTDQTSGTITDDSDIWLFGARHVYKNFFSQDKYVEYYQEWWTEAQKCKKMQPSPYDTKVKKKLRQLELAPGFPNPAVAEAYLHPVNHFGWTKLKTDEVLLPVLKQLNAQQTQLRIDSFFRLAQQERQAIKSQRLRRAVTCMKRKEKEEEEREVLEATEALEGASKRRRGEESEQEAQDKVPGGKRHQRKRRKCRLPKEQSFGVGGFVGEIQLSEASSGSSGRSQKMKLWIDAAKEGELERRFKLTQQVTKPPWTLDPLKMDQEAVAPAQRRKCLW